jgi:hypothetical protein
MHSERSRLYEEQSNMTFVAPFGGNRKLNLILRQVDYSSSIVE